MNQYRRGSTTFVSSRLGSACVRAHLKVENPVLLRTIYILIYCRPASCLSPCNAILIYAEGFDQKLKIAISADGDTKIARKKSSSRTGEDAQDNHASGLPRAVTLVSAQLFSLVSDQAIATRTPDFQSLRAYLHLRLNPSRPDETKLLITLTPNKDFAGD